MLPARCVRVGTVAVVRVHPHVAILHPRMFLLLNVGSNRNVCVAR